MGKLLPNSLINMSCTIIDYQGCSINKKTVLISMAETCFRLGLE